MMRHLTSRLLLTGGAVGLVLWLSACAPQSRPDLVAQTRRASVPCDELQRFAASLRAQGDPVGSASPSVLVEEYVLTRLLAGEGNAAAGADDVAARWQRRLQLAERAVAPTPVATPTPEAPPTEAAEATPTIDDAAIAAYYESHRDEFERPERRRTRLILIRLEAGASAAARREATARLRDIQAKFLSGTPFADLAVRFSEADNATFGGDVGLKARGEMPAAFDAVAWSMEPGEVSDVVTLPEGLALILVEAVEPPRSASLDEVRDEIRAHLESPADGAAVAVADATPPSEPAPEEAPDALDEARRGCIVTIDREALLDLDLDPSTTPVVSIDGEPLRLTDLGMTTRAPGVDSSLARAIDTELLARLALRQGAGDAPGDAPGVGPSPARQHADAMAALERRVDALLPETSDDALRLRYAAEVDRWQRPERRMLEVVRVMAESGDLGSARAAAEALGRVWRPAAAVPQRHRAEVWGPISREDLAAATSRDLADTAFTLEPGVVSQPLLVERTWPELAYVLLRVARVEPAGPAPFEEVRPRLLAETSAPERDAVRARLRTELLAEAALRTLPALFACELTAPIDSSAIDTSLEALTPTRQRRGGQGWPASSKQREAAAP